VTRRQTGKSGPPSGLRYEARRFGRLAGMLIRSKLDRFFDTTASQGSRRRLGAAMIVLAVGTVGTAVQLAAMRNWAGADLARSPWANPATFMSLAAIRFFLLAGIASGMALSAAGIYVADVFEIRNLPLAWNFLSDLAWGVVREDLHLREGKIPEDEQKSTAMLIGGPARVYADRTTTALFEKPDGTPRVVGPADNGSEGRSGAQPVVLDGFERLRGSPIDLRDQYFGSRGAQALTVVGRSADGVPVSVIDVRGVFSVRREGGNEASESHSATQYKIRAVDVQNLTYKQTVPALAEGPAASGLPGAWTEIMTELIRDSLREFMAEHRLSEFLAGVGGEEIDRAELAEDTILARSMGFTQETPATLRPGSSAVASLRPRTELSARFRKYGSEFSTAARQVGLELHWIGVGTWKLPGGASGAIIDRQHLEASRINRENQIRSGNNSLEAIADSAAVEQKLHLIQEVPIASHEKSSTRYSDKEVLLEYLLQDFWEQFGVALEIHYRAEATSADLDAVESATLKVEELLGIQGLRTSMGTEISSKVRPRSADSSVREGPPAPESRGEEVAYRSLLEKLGGDYRVAEAMLASEAQRHSGLTREQLLGRILARFDRHDR
jgi:hypothetical protein